MVGSMEGEVKITPRNSRGWRAVTETLTRVRAEIVHLQGALVAANAENARLRAALEAALDALRAAPGRDEVWPGITGLEHLAECYFEWYDGPRQAALKEEE